MPSPNLTEAEARALLRTYRGYDMIERWIAEQPWLFAPGGWTVSGELQRWQFHVEIIPAGLQITAAEPGVAPVTWVIPG
jgi:hypothetical protein